MSVPQDEEDYKQKERSKTGNVIFLNTYLIHSSTSMGILRPFECE
jgi:hypothetical protein